MAEAHLMETTATKSKRLNLKLEQCRYLKDVPV
jgi:hypothetical protein